LTNSGVSLRLLFYLHSIIIILFANCLLTFGSYFYYLVTLEAVISSSRMLLSALLVYFLRPRLNRERVLTIIMFVVTLNGGVVGLQVLEQALNNNFLPDILRYGGIWGFSESHDYEIFKKGGLFPSTQTSSFLSLVLIGYIVAQKRSFWLLSPNIIAVLFGGRTTMILAAILLVVVLIKMTYSALTNVKLNQNISVKSLTVWAVYIAIMISLIYVWFNSEFGEHHLFRIQQAFNVVRYIDFSGGDSGGGAFQFFKLPPDGLEVLIGNGLPRFHELGGNDPFYPRWLLQSGIFSLISLLLVFLICFMVERRNTNSLGIITILLLIQGFKGELLTSTFVFDIYLLYLFLRKSA